MKRNKFINFLILISVILSFGIFNFTNSHYETVNAADTIENPRRSCIYLYDNDLLWKDAVSIVANFDKHWGSIVTEPMTNYNDYLYYCEIPAITTVSGFLYISFTYKFADGSGSTTEERLIEVGNGIIAYDTNYDTPILLSKSGSTYTTNPIPFSSKKYVYFAYKTQPGERVFIRYSYDNNKHVYEFPMIYTGIQWGASDKEGGIQDIYRSCIYSPNNVLTNLEFFVKDHSNTITKSIKPITVSTESYVWNDMVYYLRQWKPFRDSEIVILFNFMDKDKQSESTVTDPPLYANKSNNFSVKVPDPYKHPKSGSTFRRWYHYENGKKVFDNFHPNDTLFVSANKTYYAHWDKGTNIYVNVDIELLNSRVSTTSDATSLTLDYGMDGISKSVSMYQIFEGSTVYEAPINLDDGKINTVNLKYTCADGSSGETGNITLDGDEITSKVKGKHYHVVLPDTVGGTDYYFRKLYTINYHYGEKNERLYCRQPVSINTIHPLFFELEGKSLEHWCTDTKLTKKFEAQVIHNDTDLYAKYIDARDYYIYVDNYQNRDWQPNSLTLYNDYFFEHTITIPIPSNYAKYLNHNIYQVRLDVSKSFKNFYVSYNDKDDNIINRTVDQKIETEYTYFDISTITKSITVDDKNYEVNEVNTEIYADCVVGAQKLPYDSVSKKNAFRFSIGVPSKIREANDYHQNTTDPNKPQDGSQTNLGFKVIFIKKDGTCYIGFWNFDSKYRLDYLRISSTELYQKDVLYDKYTYDGFYALTIRDDISFKYSDFDHILIAGVYKDAHNKLKVVKATEYLIRTREEGNVDIYYQANHIIE